MIVSRPRTRTLTALTLFLILVFASFFALLHSLLSGHDFFIAKLVLSPIVLVIGLLVLSKLLAAIKIVKVGNQALEVWYPVTRVKTRIQVADILGWREEVIDTRNGEFREVKILYSGNKILKLSNRENTDYPKVVSYLKRKIKKQN